MEFLRLRARLRALTGRALLTYGKAKPARSATPACTSPVDTRIYPAQRKLWTLPMDSALPCLRHQFSKHGRRGAWAQPGRVGPRQGVAPATSTQLC